MKEEILVRSIDDIAGRIGATTAADVELTYEQPSDASPGRAIWARGPNGGVRVRHDEADALQRVGAGWDPDAVLTLESMVARDTLIADENVEAHELHPQWRRKT